MTCTWPTVRLGEAIAHRKEFIHIDDLAEYKRCRVQLHTKGIVLRDIVPGATIKTKSQQVCRAGEFLVAEIDAKVGGFGIVPDELDGAIVSSHYFLFTIDESRLNLGFLGYFVRTPTFRDQVAAQGSTNYAAIRPGHVLEYEIPLPPLSEQRRIVAKIDHLAAKIDEAHSLRASAALEMQALAVSSTDRCFQALAQRGTPIVSFEDACDRITVGHVSSMRHAYREQGVPFLRSQNVRPNRFEPEGLCFIAPEFHEANQKSALRPGHIVVVRTGFVGIACVIPRDIEDANCADLVIIHPGQQLNPYYGSHFLNSHSGLSRAAHAAVGSAQKHYNVKAMRKTKMPLPPLDEQRRIVTYLDSFQAQVNRLNALQEKSAAELDALLPAVLDKAFKGELVAPETIRIAASAEAKPAQPAAVAAGPRKHSRGIYFKRGAIAAYIIDRLHHRPEFGRVMFEKCLYMAETYVGVDLEGSYKRAAAGPLDAEYLNKLESLAAKRRWFTKRKSTGTATRYAYRPGRDAADRLAAAAAILGDRRERMDRLLDLMAMQKMDTERAEIVATLFAAWNDLLIAAGARDADPSDPRHPSDDEIIAEVRNCWHAAKQRFTADRLQQALGWMRDQGLVPCGMGPATRAAQP